MVGKSKSVKIGKVEINRGTVTYTAAFIIALMAFTGGVVAYRYIFMILPSRPGCVTISIKDPGGKAVKDANVEVYLVVVTKPEIVASGMTGRGGKITFCDVFEPDTEYRVEVNKAGTPLWADTFTTNERSTADVPIIVREEVVA